MFGLCSEKKYLNLKEEYESKMAEINNLCKEIDEKVNIVSNQNAILHSSVRDINEKIETIWNYLTENGRKKTINGIQYSDFEIFVKHLDNPSESDAEETADTQTSRPKRKRKV